MANLSNINGKFVVEQTTGYVGVGTTDPNYPIEVLNASAEIALNASGGSTYRIQSDSASNFIIRKEGVGDRLVINSAGNATFAGNVAINTFASITNDAGIAGIAIRAKSDNICYIDFGDSADSNIGGINYSNINDTLNFRTGNTNKVTIDSSGNSTFAGNATFAGNGVEITSTEVIITPNIATSAFVLNGQSRKYKMLNYSNQFYIQDFTVNAPSSTTRFMINGDGDIGIGTTNPSTKLEIFGNNSARNTIQNLLTINGGTSSNNVYDGFGMGIKFNGRDYSNQLRDYAYINSVMQVAGTSTPGGDPSFSTQLQFWTNTGGAANTLPTKKMTIYASGNVETTGNLIINKFSNTAPYADGEIRFTGRYDRYVGGIKTFTDNASYPEYANGLDFFVQRHVYALPNGHLAMRIDSSGNVGIGTDSPDSKLHVESTSATGANFILETTHPGGIPLLDLKGAASAQLRYKDELNVIQGRIDFGDSGTFNFIDVPNNNSTLYLKTGGNVGIGTTSPANKLDVEGRIQGDNFVLGGSDSTVFYGMYRAGTETREVRLVSYEATPNSKVQLGMSNLSGSSYTFAPALTVKANLRVGVGTIDPLNILHIKDTGVIFRIEDTVQGLIGFIGDANAAGEGADGDFGIRTTNNLSFMVGGSTERMRITSGGRVEVTGNVLSINTVDEYRQDFTTTGASTPSFDIDLKSIGASGQPFEVFVAWTHYSTGYGAGLHQAYYQRSTVQSNITLIHTYFNQTSSNGGAWSVVWLTGTEIRVQKSAGTHGSQGYGYIRVTRLKP